MKKTTTNKGIDLTAADAALPDDFDPMELAAFLDGEDNTEMATALVQSTALQAVAAAGLDMTVVVDADAAQSLAARAAPLARRAGAVEAQGSASGILTRLTGWLGADSFGAGWRGATAGVVLGVVGFGTGLAGGLGLGDVGVSSDDILASAGVLQVFDLDSSTATSDLYSSDAFESVFGSF